MNMKISKGDITYQVIADNANNETISKDQLAQLLSITTGTNLKPLLDINPNISVEIKKDETTLIAITPKNLVKTVL